MHLCYTLLECICQDSWSSVTCQAWLRTKVLHTCLFNKWTEEWMSLLNDFLNPESTEFKWVYKNAEETENSEVLFFFLSFSKY